MTSGVDLEVRLGFGWLSHPAVVEVVVDVVVECDGVAMLVMAAGFSQAVKRCALLVVVCGGLYLSNLVFVFASVHAPVVVGTSAALTCVAIGATYLPADLGWSTFGAP